MIPGTLIRRYKRFLADVELETGEKVVAHCPNSGSMLGSIENGAPVYLSPADNPNRKTRFTWEMIHLNGDWVGINTGVPNKLVAMAARERALPIFEDVTEVRTEVKLGKHSRIDVVAETSGGPIYVEVKNVTLVRDGIAEFPDSITTRGGKHLTELTKVVEEGGRAAMVYIVQRTDSEVFGPARDIDKEYSRLYDIARQTGVTITAVEAKVTPERIRLNRLLPVFI